MTERRKYMRFEIPLQAVVMLNAEAEIEDGGRIRDLSRNGLRMVLTKKNFMVGSPIELKVTHPLAQTKIPVTGEIAWSVAEDGQWEVGIRIKEMDKAAKSEILEYAYLQWKKKSLENPEGAA